MKKYLALFLIATLVMGCSPLKPGEKKQEEKTPVSLSYEDEDFQKRYEANKPSEKELEAIKTFSTKSYQLLRRQENSFYSPTSLYLALSMLMEGAEGTSLDQLKSLMGEPIEAKKLMEHLAVDTKDTMVYLANSLWVHQDFEVLDSYKKTLVEEHYASAFNRNLHTAETMKEISQWISKKTKGKIEPELDVNDEAMLYLVNTLYLKGAWHDAFEKENTKEDTFYGKEEIKADFMHQKVSGDYLEEKDYQLAKRNLSEGMAMYFVLPKEGKSLADISYEDVLSKVDKLEFRQIQWSMPKIKLSTEMNLIEPLKELGVTDIFTNRADFSKISKEPLLVSLIKQFTDLEVNEEGVEAAAATIIGMEKSAMPPEEVVEMKLNRPFGILIIHREVPLFMGEIYNPLGSKQ